MASEAIAIAITIIIGWSVNILVMAAFISALIGEEEIVHKNKDEYYLPVWFRVMGTIITAVPWLAGITFASAILSLAIGATLYGIVSFLRTGKVPKVIRDL